MSVLYSYPLQRRRQYSGIIRNSLHLATAIKHNQISVRTLTSDSKKTRNTVNSFVSSTVIKYSSSNFRLHNVSDRLNKNKTIWNILNIPLHCLKLKTFSTITRTNYKNEGDSYRRRFHSNNSTTCLTGISNFSTTANHADITWKNKTEDNDEHNQDSKNKESSTATNENNEMSVNNKYYYLIKQKYTATRHQKYKPNLLDGTLQKTISNKPFKERVIQSYTDILAYFMPKGYPESVGKGYPLFAAGQMVSMVLSSAGGVLSMQSLLCAIGIGASEALPLAATLNWVIKDGLGQLGGVIFASVVSNRFDADPKRWRMLASISMDLASFIELLTPFFPGYFLPLASVANVGKNISFLAASASRAAIHKTFAVHENLADITAKTGSQCILGSMLGTGLGIGTIAVIGDNYEYTFLAFSVFTALSLGSTFISLKGAILPSLSIARLDVILQHHLQFSKEDPNKVSPSRGGLDRIFLSSKKSILNPTELTEREFLLGSRLIPGLPPLVVGADLHQAIHSENELKQLLSIFHNDQYLISIRANHSQTCETHLLLKEHASKRDLLLGLIHSYIVRHMLMLDGYKSNKFDIGVATGRGQQAVMNLGQVAILEYSRELLHRQGISLEEKTKSVSNDNSSGNSSDDYDFKKKSDNDIGSNDESDIDDCIFDKYDDIKSTGRINDSKDSLTQPQPNYNLNLNPHIESSVRLSDINSKSNNGIGNRTLSLILSSPWLVEELLLETRHARLEIKQE